MKHKACRRQPEHTYNTRKQHDTKVQLKSFCFRRNLKERLTHNNYIQTGHSKEGQAKSWGGGPYPLPPHSYSTAMFSFKHLGHMIDTLCRALHLRMSCHFYTLCYNSVSTLHLLNQWLPNGNISGSGFVCVNKPFERYYGIAPL